MLCKLHSVYKILHCIHCVNYYTVKGQFFAFNLEKITPGRNFLHRHRLWRLWQIWGMWWQWLMINGSFLRLMAREDTNMCYKILFLRQGPILAIQHPRTSLCYMAKVDFFWKFLFWILIFCSRANVNTYTNTTVLTFKSIWGWIHIYSHHVNVSNVLTLCGTHIQYMI